jgi:hypothetical protein
MKMNNTQAKVILAKHNKWRRGGGEMPYSPIVIGQAIDVLLAAPEKRYTELSQKLIDAANGENPFFSNEELKQIKIYSDNDKDNEVFWAKFGDATEKLKYQYYLLMVAEELSW